MRFLNMQRGGRRPCFGLCLRYLLLTAGKGNALSRADHQEDMELICEMGANTIRLAHYQHDQYFYDLCDEKGMVIWAEIPYISRHMEKGRENTVSQMKELISHPAVSPRP